MSDEMPDTVTLSDEELAARKKRNMFLALAIVLFMALVMAITMVRLQEGVARDQDWAAETGGVPSEPVIIEAPNSQTQESPDA